jgi:hypothetical protein
MRDFQLTIIGAERDNLTRDPAKAIGIAMLTPDRRHQLHTDANAQKWNAALVGAFFQHLNHASRCVQTPAAIGEGADAGQDDTVGFAHDLSIAADNDLFARCLSGHPLKRLFSGP